MSVKDEDDKIDTSNLSDELAKLDDDSLGSSTSNRNFDSENELIEDAWIEELECALLADCDPVTLKKISEGKRIPTTLRPDYWRALLSANDSCKVKLNGEYDLDNQLLIRQDCEALVEDIAMNLTNNTLNDANRLRLKSDFESTLTTYIKARPELSYVSGNGWTDILRVLYHLDLSDVQLYQMFFRIVDRYIPKDLSQRPPLAQQKQVHETDQKHSESSSNVIRQPTLNDDQKTSTIEPLPIPDAPFDSDLATTKLESNNQSVQAYHLLRLLIQYHDPELCSILDSKKVTPNLYVKDWFCSLFARNCTPKLALIIWDTHFKMADPFLIFFAAIVMVANASDELKKSNMSQSDMLNILKTMPSRLEENDIEDLYYLVSNHYTNSTPRSIRSYSHLFFMDTFGNTYSGSDSPEDSPRIHDLKTSQLTSNLDLSQYLCLPIVPAEIFSFDTVPNQSNRNQLINSLRYFLVDCRPAEQYNAGHLTKAFHLDCSLMLREPSSFATAVQALLEIQRQVVASNSNTGGQHLCFIGSGQEEEDQYVNMVVASFLQKCQKYVSIVVGGFEAIHNHVSSKSYLKESFNRYIVDHNLELCKICNMKNVEGGRKSQASISSAQSLFASTTSFLRGDKGTLSAVSFSKIASNPQATATANMIAQSGASMFDKFTTAFVSKSSIIKDRLVETLNTTTIPTATGLTSSTSRDHVSSQDKLGKRYTGSGQKYTIDDNDDDLSNRNFSLRSDAINEPIQEIQIENWQAQANIISFHKCTHIKGAYKYSGYIALSKTHLWILREIAHNKGFASIAAKRPLDTIVQITSKRRQPDLIIFRYGLPNQQRSKAAAPENAGVTKGLPEIVTTDQLHIPQAFEVIRLIKREIVRIMDENSKAATSTPAAEPSIKENAAMVEEKSEETSSQHKQEEVKRKEEEGNKPSEKHFIQES